MCCGRAGTPHQPLPKVFDRPFFKKVVGSWGRALSRLRRGETPKTPCHFAQRNMFFFAAAPSKKNGKNQFNVSHEMLCEQILSVLFGKIAAKRTKNGVFGVSPLRRRLRALPQDPATFLKKGRSKTFVRGWWGVPARPQHKTPADYSAGVRFIGF